jgi:CMP-N-acetylneuraminic acid synthetase
MSDVTAVIIGRAGSKGLPGKNTAVLADRPLVTFSIDHARQSKTVRQVWVSTDSPEVAAVARSEGVAVIDRPAALATDTARVDDAVRHAIRAADDHAPIVVILYANVPIRPGDLTDRAVRRLHETGADSVQSYSDVGKFHPAWMVELDDEGRVEPREAGAIHRRQELPRVYVPDGGVIAVTKESLFAADGNDNPHAFFGAERRGIVNGHGDVIDIDSLFDLSVAEALV